MPDILGEPSQLLLVRRYSLGAENTLSLREAVRNIRWGMEWVPSLLYHLGRSTLLVPSDTLSVLQSNILLDMLFVAV